MQSVDVDFTRADSSLVTFPLTVRAWRGPYDGENRNTEAVHIMAGEYRATNPRIRSGSCVRYAPMSSAIR